MGKRYKSHVKEDENSNYVGVRSRSSDKKLKTRRVGSVSPGQYVEGGFGESRGQISEVTGWLVNLGQ